MPNLLLTPTPLSNRVVTPSCPTQRRCTVDLASTNEECGHDQRTAGTLGW